MADSLIYYSLDDEWILTAIPPDKLVFPALGWDGGLIIYNSAATVVVGDAPPMVIIAKPTSGNLGSITGQMLSDNLLRDGKNLAFDSRLLYLDVGSNCIGINNDLPTRPLDVRGTTKTTKFESQTAEIDKILISDNTIKNTSGGLVIEPATPDPYICMREARVGGFLLYDSITTTSDNVNDITLGKSGATVEFKSATIATDTITKALTTTKFTNSEVVISDNTVTFSKPLIFKNNLDISDTTAVVFPHGQSSSRNPTPTLGETWYNETSDDVETFDGTSWVTVKFPDPAKTIQQIKNDIQAWSIIFY